MRVTQIAMALSLLMLAGCGIGGDEQDDAREATGEILPSSISDGMIETDSLQSQPPLLREMPAVEGEEAGEGEGEPGEPETLEEAFAGDASEAEASGE